MSDNLNLANALHDREEAKAMRMDLNGPYECSGILWRTVDGEPTADGAVWSSGWRELLDDAASEWWAVQRSVFQELSVMRNEPEEGGDVPRSFATLMFSHTQYAIADMAQEAGR